MEVLLTSTDNPYITRRGGKHIHLLLLERGLKTLGLQVTTLYYNPKSLKECFRRSIFRLFPEKYGYEAKIKSMMEYLKRHTPKNVVNLIHAHDVLSLLALSSMPQKKVLTLHGYFARENIEFIKKERHRESIYRFLLQLEKKAMNVPDYVITVDRRLKDYIVRELNYPEEKIKVIYNAIDTNCFNCVPKTFQSILKKNLGFKANNLIVLVPRRLVEKNGVIYAVRAMKYLKHKIVTMVIVGDGPERKKISKEAKKHSGVHLMGTVPHDKIDVFYKMADIVLIPSITSHEIQEASSLAMLEGMACGKIVICSNIGGIREIVQNMKNGILVEEKNPLQIAKAIETIMENPNLIDEIGNRAREYVLQNHSFLSHASEVIKVYQEVLGGRFDV
jgi:glycosyltransferase involved in cell wall biosynthesis